MPRVRWGFGPGSTIFVHSEKKRDSVLTMHVGNLWHSRQVLDVLINGKTIRRILLNAHKQGEFQEIKIPIELEKGRNKLLLKYSKWKENKNKKKLAMLFSQVNID